MVRQKRWCTQDVKFILGMQLLESGDAISREPFGLAVKGNSVRDLLRKESCAGGKEVFRKGPSTQRE